MPTTMSLTGRVVSQLRTTGCQEHPLPGEMVQCQFYQLWWCLTLVIARDSMERKGKELVQNAHNVKCVVQCPANN